MSPDKQRIAIAEACGWKVKANNGEAWLWKNGNRFHVGVWLEKREPALGDFKIIEYLPDYLTDLNAMHKAEKVLNDDQQKKYVEILMKDEHNSSSDYCQEYIWDSIYSFCLHATATQRAEAFLRTIGKWEEGT